MMKAGARKTWIVGLALVAVTAGAFAGVRVWRVWREPLRFFSGVRYVCAIDADHPYIDGLPRQEAIDRTADIVLQRVKHFAPLARVDVRGTRLDVQVPAWKTTVTPTDIAQLITRSGRLELKLVDDGSDTMKEWAQNVGIQVLDGVDIDHDEWKELQGDRQHRDVFLRASDEARLRSAFAGLTLPADHQIAFEKKLDPEDGHVIWRSYYLFRHAEVTAEDIIGADVVLDPQSNRPEVRVRLDEDGARRFEALTARAVGRRLAILFEEHVRSAPVVESKIAGGNIRITLGRSALTDPESLKRDAIDLVSILRRGSFGAPVRILETHEEGPQP